MTRTRTLESDRVGPYQLLHAIGAGGSARVDLARIDRVYGFQRHVVVKRPLEHLRADPKVNESLRREARLGGRLRHPNLVSVLDAGIHDGYDYIALEYIHGGSLRTLMQSDEPSRVRELPIEVALTIVRDIARGLHEAHEIVDETGTPSGLVHRDVSPGNVLIGLDGAVKLADFGIATETRVTTLSGSMIGTVTYMAPEQCRGLAIDRRADVFSLGVILYEMLTSHRLFWADNDVATLHRVLEGRVPRAREVKPSVPAALDDIVMATLTIDPDRRMPTARALAEALEAFAAPPMIIASRIVARWVGDVIGPRDQPWIGEPTKIDAMPLADEPDSMPLVDVIRATGGDPIETPVERARTQRRPRLVRTVVAVAIAGALLGGGLLTALVVGRTDDGAVAPPLAAEPAAASVPTVAPATLEVATPSVAPITTSEPKGRVNGKHPLRAPAKAPAPRSDKATASNVWDEQMLFPSETGSGTTPR